MKTLFCMRWEKKRSIRIPPNNDSGSTSMSCFWGMGARTSLRQKATYINSYTEWSRAQHPISIMLQTLHLWFCYVTRGNSLRQKTPKKTNFFLTIKHGHKRSVLVMLGTGKWKLICAHSVGGALLLDAAELELVLGSSAIPPPSRNMVTAISRLLLHASSICFPTLSVAPESILGKTFFKKSKFPSFGPLPALVHWNQVLISRYLHYNYAVGLILTSKWH